MYLRTKFDQKTQQNEQKLRCCILADTNHGTTSNQAADPHQRSWTKLFEFRCFKFHNRSVSLRFWMSHVLTWFGYSAFQTWLIGSSKYASESSTFAQTRSNYIEVSPCLWLNYCISSTSETPPFNLPFLGKLNLLKTGLTTTSPFALIFFAGRTKRGIPGLTDHIRTSRPSTQLREVVENGHYQVFRCTIARKYLSDSISLCTRC